jgi:predicted dehydrogenase
MRKFTRRELLEDALFASTTAALATAGVRGAAAEEPRKSGKTFGPNDQIRIAVIGVKSRGRDHISGYTKFNDVTIAALCDVDPSVFPSAAKIVTDAGKPEPKYVQDLRRIMDDPNIDAVSIATPNHWHSLAAIWALQAGKDVYVEKPVSHNVHEGRVMVDLAHKKKLICQAGTQCRSMKGSIDAIEYIRSGKIGKVEIARGLCYKPRNSIGKVGKGDVPAGLDYNLWCGPAPMKPLTRKNLHYDWHWVWDTGNGDLGNQGIHQVDVARWGLGKDGMPKSVIGFGGRLGYEDDGETPNTHVMIMDYGDSQLIFETRGLKTNDYRGAKIGNIFHGTDGYVVMTSYSSGAAFDKDGKMVTTFSGGGDHYRNFIDAMRSRKSSDLRGEVYEGHLSSALCHLGNISYLVGEPQSFGRKPDMDNNEAAYETLQRFEQHLSENGVDMQNGHYKMGRKLNLDVKKERFKGDKEANKLLTRDYRAGFEVPDKA